MKIFFVLLITGSTMLPVYAQQDSTALTIEEAIAEGLQNRAEVRIQNKTVDIYKNEEAKIRTRNLPQINADADLRLNTQLQTNVIPANSITPGAPERRIQFGTRYNTFLNFTVNQSLLNFHNATDRDIAKQQTEYQQINKQLTDIQIKQEVTEAYLNALIWKEKSNLASTNELRTKALLTIAEDQLKEGVITSYDLLKYKLDYQNAKAEQNKNNLSYKLALEDLAYKMGKKDLTNFKLEDLNNIYSKFKSDYQESANINRVELGLEQKQQNIYQLNARKARLGLVPNVYLYGNYSLQQLTNRFNPLLTDRYYPFNYLGIKATIPIYNGGLRGRTANEFLLRKESSELNYEKLKSDYEQEMRTAYTNLKNAEQDLAYQKENLSAAEELYKIDTDRLKNGVIRQSDLSNTYYTLQQTQNNYISSLYNYLVAVVRFKKATGSL